MSSSPDIHPDLHLFLYTLQLADNALIHGHRLSEWCGHGPVLEQDIAITNIALDHIGQARSLYQYAARLFNEADPATRSNVFMAPVLEAKIADGIPVDEDDLAYLRDSWDFRNILLTEQTNTDWAYTIIKCFLYDSFQYYLYDALQQSADQQLAAIAEKSKKEVGYHLRWSAEWTIRLGDGTEESHNRITKALNDLYSYQAEFWKSSPWEEALQASGICPDLETLKDHVLQHQEKVFSEAGIKLPEQRNSQEFNTGKLGIHSEYLGFILTELQFMQRTYPGMKW